ncbi:tRNA 2-thiouridine(34) synthase MnmA [Patescibacteria group bacterium]|nr:tRNA 2-thiouridine(34) synthase MnmA [Patescibacteria group bacterium]
MIKNITKKIVVGMSGGVDSTMALVLLKKLGWEPIGVSLKYCVWKDKENLLRANVCCSTESFAMAKKVCKKLNVPYYIYDVSREFKSEVIEYFISELKNNKTPNPCVMCNPNLKFKKLFEWAKRHKIDYVATGHYARINNNKLLIAKDKSKDQTYSLSHLPQKYLSKIVFPLGDLTKDEIYKMAKKQGFDFYLKTKQSQDFCFVAGKSMSNFLSKEIGQKLGEMQDKSGKVLGQHNGLHFYTIGQRKGIKLAGGPYFVIGFDVKKNILIVSKNKKDLLSKLVVLSPVHFINPVQSTRDKFRARVKIRSQHKSALATIKPHLDPLLNRRGRKAVELIFDKPQVAITPGQFAVFYQRNICLGGGNIV